jgi:hypothetical protein
MERSHSQSPVVVLRLVAVVMGVKKESDDSWMPNGQC